jgi:hypothetical protein
VKRASASGFILLVLRIKRFSVFGKSSRKTDIERKGKKKKDALKNVKQIKTVTDTDAAISIGAS